jgi:hypothetical protein
MRRIVALLPLRAAASGPRFVALLSALSLGAAGCSHSVSPEVDAGADADASASRDVADTGVDPNLLGTLPESCGRFGPEASAPVDCTASGDRQAVCVFGDHCGCSEGFRCTEPFSPDQANCAGRLCECARGATCVPR